MYPFQISMSPVQPMMPAAPKPLPPSKPPAGVPPWADARLALTALGSATVRRKSLGVRQTLTAPDPPPAYHNGTEDSQRIDE